MTEDDAAQHAPERDDEGPDRPEWAIEPRPDQESVWDYPRPPAIDPDTRLVRVVHEGTVIAETRRAVRLLETGSPPTFYLPPDDVRTDLLEPGGGASLCEFKGSARFHSLRNHGVVVPKVAWSYDEPFPSYIAIKGAFSFYPSKVECYVDGERVQAQAVDRYGGWITEEIVGPFKGDPGAVDV